MARTPIVAGNWKMNLDRDASVGLGRDVAALAGLHQDLDIAIFPSVVWMTVVADAVAGGMLTVGSQDCYTEPSGAFTGEISPVELAASFDSCLIGHSERRHVLGEGDDLIAAKLRAALDAGLTAYLCVGETLEERDAGDQNVVVERQLELAIGKAGEPDLASLVIAYEPVWAIGTGRAATADDAQEMCAGIRGWMHDRFNSAGDDVRVLYGGSVSPDNAAELFAKPDIDGGLIGGASLKIDSFTSIVEAALQRLQM